MSMTSSAKKAAYNESNESLYNPYPNFVVPDYFPYDPPWPEWSDSDVNAEKWDDGKVKANPKSTNVTDSIPVYFTDPEAVPVPPGLDEYVSYWKRPVEVYPNADLRLYVETNTEFQLFVPSQIASESGIFDSMMELLSLVQFHAFHEGFPVEQETLTYTSNTQGVAWRPWHHIYALCKAGKGQAHKPLYCPYGKYVLRLFHMGAWRKFVVDDRIPCDEHGNCMLPVTQIPGEVWPLVLWKGLLKIMSLTPTSCAHAMDLPFLSIFTGWIDAYFPTINKSREEIWRWLWALTPHYEYPAEKNETKEMKATSSVKESKKTELKIEPSRNCLLIGTLSDFPKELPLSECQRVGLMMCRNVPLIKVEKRRATQAWKRLRWVHWANERGVWTDELLIPPYRCVQYFTYIKKLNDLLLFDYELENRLFVMPALDELTRALQATQIGGKDSYLLQPRSPEDHPVQWSDFTRLTQYLLDLHILYRPCVFMTKTKITYIRLGPPAKGGISPGGVAKSPPNTYYLSPSLTLTQNEPPLLFCESPEGIFIVFSLSVSPSMPVGCRGYLAPRHPRSLKVYHASLLVERYDWRSLEQGEILGDVKTVGSDALCITLNPGRHVLRLWLDTDSPFVIQLYSNVEVTIFKPPKIRFLMSYESFGVMEYVNSVSNAFLSLSQRYGKPEFRKFLSNFYEALRPRNDVIVGYYKHLDRFIETFFSRLIRLVRTLIPSDEEFRSVMNALRTLFVNPNINYPLPILSVDISGKKASFKSTQILLKARTLSEVLCYDWSAEEIEKIVTIQRIFRGYRVRILLKNHNPSSKEFKIYAEKLKKIGDVLFAPAKRESEVGRLIRDIAIAQPELIPMFRVYKDIPNVIQIQEFSGTISAVEPYIWVPLIRFVVACHSEVPVPCSFVLSCNLEQFTVVGVDNDTNRELFRLSNALAQHYYTPNRNGYTILSYGWNESDFKNVNWRMEILTMKHFQVVHPCNVISNLLCCPYRPPNLEIRELRNYYIPNHRFRICRCLIKVRKKMLLTVRISVSHSEVHFDVQITQGRKDILSDTESWKDDSTVARAKDAKAAIIFPALILDHCESCLWGESDGYTVYTLDVTVRHNSWPLTTREWGVVEPIRTAGEQWPVSTSSTSLQAKISSTSSRRRPTATRSSKRALVESKVFENPYWLLQVVSDDPDDMEPPDSLVVLEDQSHAEAIRSMKVSWEDVDPGRTRRGTDSREAFLRKIYLEEKKGREVVEGFQGEFYGEADELVREDSFEALLQQTRSFKYLLDHPSPLRTSVSPRVLPKMPTSLLLEKYGRGRRLSFQSSEMLHAYLDQVFSEAQLFTAMLDEIESERKLHSEKARQQRSDFERHILMERTKSQDLMEQAYAFRFKHIERFKKKEKEMKAATVKK